MNRIAILASAVLAGGCALMAERAPRYNLGRPATPEEIRKRDISVAPDGTGLPVGHGTVEQGRYIYKVLCANCHGDHGQGVGDYPALAGGQGTLQSAAPVLTVGCYLPYVTTMWDYTHPALPYPRPRTPSPD